MGQFAEVADALDEICDEFLNEDEHGNIINLKLRDVVDLDPLINKQLTEEFSKFINLFDLKERGWEYVRALLVDGELYFEHVIHEKYKHETSHLPKSLYNSRRKFAGRLLFQFPKIAQYPTGK